MPCALSAIRCVLAKPQVANDNTAALVSQRRHPAGFDDRADPLPCPARGHCQVDEGDLLPGKAFACDGAVDDFMGHVQYPFIIARPGRRLAPLGGHGFLPLRLPAVLPTRWGWVFMVCIPIGYSICGTETFR